jgi:hypothetical protein
MNEKMQSVKNMLPNSKYNMSNSVQEWLRMQEDDLNRMAQLLEDVTHHFDQMESALRDSDAGEILEDEDMEGKRYPEPIYSPLLINSQSWREIRTNYRLLLGRRSKVWRRLGRSGWFVQLLSWHL